MIDSVGIGRAFEEMTATIVTSFVLFVVVVALSVFVVWLAKGGANDD